MGTFLSGPKSITKFYFAMVFGSKKGFDQSNQKGEKVRKEKYATTFTNLGGVSINVRKGCSVIGDLKLIICYLGLELRWYVEGSGVWVIF